MTSLTQPCDLDLGGYLFPRRLSHVGPNQEPRPHVGFGRDEEPLFQGSRRRVT